jgi:hypothetical protein
MVQTKGHFGADGQSRTDDLLITNHCTKNDIAIAIHIETLKIKHLAVYSPDAPSQSNVDSAIQSVFLPKIERHSYATVAHRTFKPHDPARQDRRLDGAGANSDR